MNKHLTISKSIWTISTWKTDEIQFGRNLIKELDELNTTKQVKPISSTTKPNIFPHVALVEFAKRNLPSSSVDSSTAKNQKHAVGIGSRLESLTDTSLVAQVGEQNFDDAAQVGGRERYATVFLASDITGTTAQISEAGIKDSNGTLMARFTTDQPQLINASNQITVSTTILHVNGQEIPT